MVAAGCVAAAFLPTAAGSETLNDALIATYGSNPTLQAERAQLRATDEGVNQAISAWRPTVIASGAIGQRRTHSRTQVNNAGGAAFVTQQRNLDPRSGDIRLEQSLLNAEDIYSFGAAKADVRTGRQELIEVEQDVLLDAVTAYVDVLRDEAVVALNLNNSQVLTRQLDASRARFDVGEITRTDVAQSEARLSGAKTSLREAEARLATSRAAYQRVVGHAPQGLEQPAGLPSLPESLDTAQSMALDGNPTLKAARAREEASRKRLNAAMGALLPTVGLSAGVAYQDDATFPGDRRRSEEYLAEVRVPIYQGGAEYSEIREARQLNSRDRIRIAESQRSTIESTTTAWENYEAARMRIVSGEEQVRANRVALDGVRQELEVGARTTLDVLDAEQEYLDAQVALAQSRRDEVVAAYALIAAIGGLTAPELGLPVDYYDPAEHYKKVRLKFFGVGRSQD
jgi:outer membrane protein